jgi:hypothetical protein
MAASAKRDVADCGNKSAANLFLTILVCFFRWTQEASVRLVEKSQIDHASSLQAQVKTKALQGDMHVF